ncbi:MAG: methyltransferase domain-containing protein [bacterium]|nr:methyltransferase domain-containing protein [bacterium]
MSNNKIKEHYDQEVLAASGGHYEDYRWFKNPLQAAGFEMTKNAVAKYLLNNERLLAANILEIGPGPGTWTELLLKRFPSTQFTLVDISRQMLKEAEARLSGRGQFTFVNGDFTAYQPAVKFDLIFSSRAIEYPEDKKTFIANIANLLVPGGTGFIITKTPHYKREWLKGRRVPSRHRRQLSPRAFKRLLTDSGLTFLGLYPVTASVPFFNSPRLNLWTAKVVSYWPLNFITINLTESYAIKFAKQEIVEVFGLPGSGKTTYAKELEKQGYRRIKVRTKWELVKYNLIFFYHYPSKFFVGLFYLVRYLGRPRWWYYKLMNLFFQHNAKLMKAKGEARAVIDQGHFQNLLSLFDWPVSVAELKNYVKHLPRPDELVILDLLPAERAKRLKERSLLPRDELSFTNQTWLLAAEANFTTFKTIVGELKVPYHFDS